MSNERKSCRDSDREDCRQPWGPVRTEIVLPLIELDKAGVIRLGARLGVPFHLTWSCFQWRAALRNLLLLPGARGCMARGEWRMANGEYHSELNNELPLTCQAFTIRVANGCVASSE